MDFFRQQDLARQNTKKLVFLFMLALLGVVISVYLLLAVAVTGYNAKTVEPDQHIDVVGLLTNWKILALVGGGTLLVVGGASAIRIAGLSGGGQIVASSLGGRLLNHNSRDRDERRILNVVEEMAIASGIPVPPVYLLDEEGINAFAAGYSPQDAVIGVTRGCVQTLTRDELQGVIAHEYSHILNGDMRMNIRLIGFVYGIMVIGLIGWQIVRIAIYSGGRRRSNSKDSSPLPLIAIGGGLIVIGALGTFFGNWIKSSISRQREYLADASAVQFTRNPEGIGGALKQIGANSVHGVLQHRGAPEFSHMFFAMGVKGKALSSLFATHPPLENRIRRIEPQWDGKLSRKRKQREDNDKPKQKPKESSEAKRRKIIHAMTAMELIGQVTPQHVTLAATLVSEIPDSLRNAARDPYGARAVLYSLLLNEEPDIRERQMDQIRQQGERGLGELTEGMSRQIAALEKKHRLPLIDMTLGSLKTLSPTQYSNFKINLDALVKADNKIDFFEWVLLRIVDQHLGPPHRPRGQHLRLERLSSQCSVLLSSLAWVGHSDATQAKNAFDRGAAVVNLPDLQLLARKEINFNDLGAALDVLNKVAMDKKQILLEACATTIVADHEVTPNEAELMRAIAESLGCPMPPLLPGQSLV